MRRWVTNMSVKLFSPGNIVPEKPGIAVNYGYVFFIQRIPQFSKASCSKPIAQQGERPSEPDYGVRRERQNL